jgi:hypothetical protein
VLSNARQQGWSVMMGMLQAHCRQTNVNIYIFCGFYGICYYFSFFNLRFLSLICLQVFVFESFSNIAWSIRCILAPYP